jgi:hypothetical protein
MLARAFKMEFRLFETVAAEQKIATVVFDYGDVPCVPNLLKLY